jgi:hypothetical protein
MTPGAVKGLGFYEAAAQIIPVLVLVVLLELRLARAPQWLRGADRVDHWAKVGFWFCGITLAEAVALITLYTEEPNLLSAVGVAFPLLLLWLLIGYAALLIPRTSRGSSARSEPDDGQDTTTSSAS